MEEDSGQPGKARITTQQAVNPRIDTIQEVLNITEHEVQAHHIYHAAQRLDPAATENQAEETHQASSNLITSEALRLRSGD